MAEEGEKSVPVVILGESGEAHLLRVQGNDHFRAGSFQDAITCYSESLVIERNSGVYSNRAQAFLELDMPEEALQDAKRALALNNGDTKALIRKAVALLRIMATVKANSEKQKDGTVQQLCFVELAICRTTAGLSTLLRINCSREHCEVGFHSLAELGQVLKHLGNAGTPVNMLSLMYVEINEDLANFFEAHQQCWKKGIGAVVVSHCSCFDAKHFLDFFSGIFQPASVFFASIDGFTPDVRESILGFPALEGAKCVHFELGVLPLLPWKIGLESLLQLVHAPIKLLSSTDQELKRDAEFSEDLFAGLQASAAAGAESPKELGPAEKQHYLDLVVKRQPGRMISIDRQMLEKTGGETEMDVLLSVLLAKLIDKFQAAEACSISYRLEVTSLSRRDVDALISCYDNNGGSQYQRSTRRRRLLLLTNLLEQLTVDICERGDDSDKNKHEEEEVVAMANEKVATAVSGCCTNNPSELPAGAVAAAAAMDENGEQRRRELPIERASSSGSSGIGPSPSSTSMGEISETTAAYCQIFSLVVKRTSNQQQPKA